MNDVVLTAIISGLCVAIPSVVASISSNSSNRKLTEYKIDELTIKVEKHNKVVERVFLLENEQKTMWNRIDDIKEKVERNDNR